MQSTNDIIESLEQAKDFFPTSLLTSGQILNIIRQMLICIDTNLGIRSEKIAFIATAIGINTNYKSPKNLLILSLLHLVGFFHFQNSSDNQTSYLYSYHYLKEMTPLKDFSKALIYIENPQTNMDDGVKEAGIIIKEATLILDYIETGRGRRNISDKYFDYYLKLNKSIFINERIRNGSYGKFLKNWLLSVKTNVMDTIKYLRLVVYIMDFKSTQTVHHTIHTASYAVALGRIAGLSFKEQAELYNAGLLHDIGKMAIPEEILDAPHRLNDEDYQIMQSHVVETARLIKDYVTESIFLIATHHHEKIDGSGYPLRLTEDELSLQDRILTVSDILSALADKRSYKDRFPKNRIIEIIQEISNAGKIDKVISGYLSSNYDLIQEDCTRYSNMFSAPLGLVEIQFQESIIQTL